jgi:DivIVA domain-containing protein
MNGSQFLWLPSASSPAPLPAPPPNGWAEILAQPAATVIVGVAAITAAWIAVYAALKGREELAKQFRDSRELDSVRQLHDRYISVVALFAAPSPAVRSAGAYALSALADDWLARKKREEAGACISVLCSYLRVPYLPVAGDSQERVKTIVRRSGTGEEQIEEQYEYRRHDENVCSGIARLINRHLQQSAEFSWRDFYFDFHGAYFRDVSFADAVFAAGVDFSGSVFGGEGALFSGAKFLDSVWFSGAKFLSGETWFDNVTFAGDTADFSNVEFGGDNVDFSGVSFEATRTEFCEAKWNSELVTFDGPRSWKNMHFDWDDDIEKQPDSVYPKSWPPIPAGSATQQTARGSSVPVDSEPSTKNIASTAELSEVQVDNAPADLAEQSPSKARDSLDEIATSDHAKSQSSTVVAASAGAAAKPIRSTPNARRGLTPEDVHNVSFSQPPSGKRGYNEDEVDGFLALVEKKLRDPTANSLTILDVHNVSFSQPPWGKRAYNVDEVDGFLDRVEEEMKRRAIERTT